MGWLPLSGPHDWGLFVRTRKDQVLPASCPRCLAPGSRPWPVPGWSRRDSRASDQSDETAFYCETCASRLEGARTRRLALVVGLSLLTVTTAVTLALYFGGVHRTWQLVSVLLVAACAELALWGVALASSAPQGIYQLDADPPVYWLARGDYAKALDADELAPHELALGRWTPWNRPPGSQGLPTLLALLAFVGTQLFGPASVRVVLGPELEAILLVDDRRRSVIMPAAAENPRAGGLEPVMGGQRHFQLVSSKGEVLAEARAVLWPGRDYLFGRPPAGSCLYFEERAYGEAGDRHLLQPLAGKGPVWELENQVDQWFVPLPERDELPTTGGIRRAVRLLPCRSPQDGAP